MDIAKYCWVVFEYTDHIVDVQKVGSYYGCAAFEDGIRYS